MPITSPPGENTLPVVHDLTIMAQTEVAPEHFRLTLNSTYIARQAKAGQFVHILPRAANTRDPLLRRAFSILSVKGDSFDVLYRVSGRGTSCMSKWDAGETVSVLGPLGKPFPSLAEYSLLVGGGVGVPPLAMLASSAQGQKVVALIGARTASDVIAVQDLTEYGAAVEVATDNGSAGHHGFVTELLREKLEQAAKSGESPIQPTVYSCGPLPMLQRVAALCRDFNVQCYVSLEEAMPCGIGVCNGCVVPIHSSAHEDADTVDGYARYKRICIDGPVLPAQDVDWSAFETNC
jgi:dihydroorotate dehydrogenase electron transfer subunit